MFIFYLVASELGRNFRATYLIRHRKSPQNKFPSIMPSGSILNFEIPLYNNQCLYFLYRRLDEALNLTYAIFQEYARKSYKLDFQGHEYCG